MESKNTQNNQLIKDFLEPNYRADICEVNKASTELMLDRFSKGNEIDFPFS